MRSLKTAVKIWKKEIEFKAITWGISPEHRSYYRKMRQDSIRHLRLHLIQDLFSRHQIGDIILTPEDFNLLRELRRTPILRKIEEVYQRYL